MLGSFKDMVSDLYKKWEEYLKSIISRILLIKKTRNFSDLFVARQLFMWCGEWVWNDWPYSSQKIWAESHSTHRRVWGANNWVHEFDFFEQVRPSYPSRSHSRLTTLIQANEFFGRGVLQIYTIWRWNFQSNHSDEQIYWICASSWCYTSRGSRMVFRLEQYPSKLHAMLARRSTT